MEPAETRQTFGMSLLRRAIRIVVTWNVIVLCLVGTVIALGAWGMAAMSASPVGSYEYVYGEGTNEFLSIKVTGTIVGSSDTSDSFSAWFDDGMAYGYDV